MAHEQNAVVGRANRLLLRFGAVLATGFKNPKGVVSTVHSVHVGNPVRKAIIEAVTPYELPGSNDALPPARFRRQPGRACLLEAHP